MILPNISYQVIKSPHLLVAAVTGMNVPLAFDLSEEQSDREPPGWKLRAESWTIEDLLGVYNENDQKISIFQKGIEIVAHRLDVPSFFVELPVRIHEYAHACTASCAVRIPSLVMQR